MRHLFIGGSKDHQIIEVNSRDPKREFAVVGNRCLPLEATFSKMDTEPYKKETYRRELIYSPEKSFEVFVYSDLSMGKAFEMLLNYYAADKKVEQKL